MIRIVLLIALSLAGAGCAEGALATAGTVAEIAAQGISTGADVYRLGKLDAADMADFDQWLGAIHRAANDLDFVIEKQELYKEGRWRCTIADADKTHARIYVERRSKTLCWTRIDVGIFGSEPTARLFLARIRLHAPAPKPSATIPAVKP